MSSRLVVPLLCGTAAIVFACGPRTHPGVQPAHARGAVTGVASLDGSRPAGAAGRAPHRRRSADSLDAWLDVVPGRDGVHLELQVVNESKRRLEIDFPDGHTRDFAVLDAAGREVWRWSTGRLFTQTVQNKFLAAGDTAVYEGRWARATAGVYTAVAVLRSRNFPVQRRVTFTLQPPSPAANRVAVASTR